MGRWRPSQTQRAAALVIKFAGPRSAALPLAARAERRSGPDRDVIYGFQDWELDLARRELRQKGASVPIGGRAMEIMEVLLEQEGRVIAKNDLMARLWPGAFVEDNTLQVHISAIRRALGPDRALLKTVSRRGYVMLGSWTRRQADVAAPAQAAPMLAFAPNAPSNLPIAGADLIGRAVAMQQLSDFMSAYRVVTLTGSGGIGKTRLALEVARSLLSRFQGDIHFVDLVALDGPMFIPCAVAAAIGLDLSGVQVTDRAVATAIGMRRTLLLLDNCEHLIDGVARLVETIVTACPHVSVLSTSREVLRVEGEYCYSVQPLDVPPPTIDDPRELSRHSAVQFLLLKAQALRGASPFDDAEIRVAAAICRRLDGIPLALEFAAARIASLGADAVLARLDERFGLLTGGRRTALPKQQTLRATLDWSYDLLTEHERLVLQVLSVFASGCTLDAAVAAAQDVLEDPWTAMDGIGNLAAKSMVSIDATFAETRWRLLETTRAYALQKLSESGRERAVRRRHAEYFHQLATGVRDKLRDGAELARFAPELDNVRSALDWAFSPTGDSALGIALTAAYVPVWLQLLLVVECVERIRQALARMPDHDGAGDEMAAWLQINLGFALLNTAAPAAMTASVLARASALAGRLDDPALQLRAGWATWSLHLNAGRYRECLDAAERVRELAGRTGNRDAALVARSLLGAALHYMGRHAAARVHQEAVVESYTAVEHRPRSIWLFVDEVVYTRSMLARVLLMLGETDQALAAAQRSLQEAEETKDALSICYALRNAICPVALTIGNLPLAEQGVDRLAELVGPLARSGIPFWIGWANCFQGQLAVRRGEFVRGAALLRAGIEARVQAGWVMRNPEFSGTLAEALAAEGRWSEALETIAGAIALCERDAQAWCLPELRRIEGEILLARSGPAASLDAGPEAEARFQAALLEAGEQGARLWALRAATSLARLWHRQGKAADAAALLKASLDDITEKQATRDVLDARELMSLILGHDR